jgi:ribosomal protein S18 acetylase RimI-like enzyme
MPRIRRQNLPRELWAHLLDRVKSRHISVDQLGVLADWLAAEPEVPHG